MLSRFIAISLTAIGLPAIASANGGERTPSAYYQVGSIDYIGYDEIGADGLPVCGPCAEKQAAATKAQKEIEARRKRARAYMARMQGQPVPDDLLEPAAAPAEDFDPAKPVRVVGDAWAVASDETDLGSLDLRPSLK
ncbi:hypothetical protein [Brucella oryzae]|uniref:Uncharacterized protein n=1 Tax=Brucella oryzae TaxID=335286 RepID=A0A2S7IXK7_9HYPH|nr:hypothetical protein [Brucella oryzae]MBR7651101.1 hypothetical protein [Brucella oryzae]PQA72698.1 hypothetical protein C3731_15055 [Brucella oryzae]